MDNYDVFISCKSEDYKYAEEVYDFLKSEGVNVFLASRELRQMGEDEYMEAISEALESTTHFIVFSSVPEYLNAKWVKTEWKTFLNEVNSGRKVGKLVTLLKDISVGQIPILLRQYESLSFDDYQNCIIKYVETPAFLARKEEEKKHAQELADAKKKKEEEEKKKEEAKQELKELAKNYSNKVSALSTDAKEIDGKLQFLNISNRTCPICESKVPLGKAYCENCGWSISPINGIEGAEYLLSDKKVQIDLMKSVWNKAGDSSYKEMIENLKADLAKKEKELSKINQSLMQKDKEFETRIQSLQKKVNDSEKKEKEQQSLYVRINSLEEDNKRLRTLNISLTDQLTEIENNVKEQQTYIVTLEKTGPAKLAIVKAVKETLRIGLKEAKDLVDGVPSLLTEDLNYENAMKIQTQFQQLGATIKISPNTKSANCKQTSTLTDALKKENVSLTENNILLRNEILRLKDKLEQNDNGISYFLQQRTIKQKDEEIAHLNKIIESKDAEIYQLKAEQQSPPNKKINKFLGKDDIYNIVSKHCKGQFVSRVVTIKYVRLDKDSLQKELKRKHNIELPRFNDSENISSLVDKIYSAQL